MGKPAGFLEYERVDGPVRSEEERVKDFREFHAMLPAKGQQDATVMSSLSFCR